MKKIRIGIIVGIAVITISLFLYKTTIMPKFSYEELRDRCKQHTSDQDCKADRFCQAYEVTPVCINTAQGQTCLPGGYQCLPNNDYVKKQPQQTLKNCPERSTKAECETTTDCGWSENKCVYVNQERQDM